MGTLVGTSVWLRWARRRLLPFLDETLRSFIWDLGKSGFVLQLISLAGLHSTATVTGAHNLHEARSRF